MASNITQINKKSEILSTVNLQNEALLVNFCIDDIPMFVNAVPICMYAIKVYPLCICCLLNKPKKEQIANKIHINASS